MLLVDNGSVYTGKLVKLLDEKRIPFEVCTPDLLDLESVGSHDSFILSGRRHNDKITNMVNSKIILHAVKNGKKLFGICYGAEILSLALGGTITKSAGFRKGMQSVMICKENPLCEGMVNVFESHRYEISKLPAGMILLGASENCKYELVQYGNDHIFGTQFHPEMSTDGHKMLERFCEL